MFDSGLVLYTGLLVLLVWRGFAGWRCCGTWLAYANYCVLLYCVLLSLLVIATARFVQAALSFSGRTAWGELPGWVRPLVLFALPAAYATLLLAAYQTSQHVIELRKGHAVVWHDRAVQIIALPAVYAVMATSSVSLMYRLFVDHLGSDQEGASSYLQKEQLYKSRSETCFLVGDLYEAWALYQFGKLTLELIRASVAKKQRSPVLEERGSADALSGAIGAVESIAWLGVSMFVIVCTLQAGWSLYLLTFTGPTKDWNAYDAQMSQFKAAGMVASAGAIYNVHVVESTFHQYFESYRAFLKFITVKIIVSFAFFQKGIVWVMRAFEQTLPNVMQEVIRKVPLVGDILHFSEVQFDVFYASLLLYECLLIAVLHWWAWSAHEAWYLEEDDATLDRPLAAHSDASNAQSAHLTYGTTTSSASV